MHEIKCQGNGRIFGISYTDQMLESWQLPPSPDFSKNWSMEGKLASIFPEFVSKRSMHRH